MRKRAMLSAFILYKVEIYVVILKTMVSKMFPKRRGFIKGAPLSII